MHHLRFIDLFAGAGGISFGLIKAGMKGVFAVEKSPMAFATLKHNIVDEMKVFDWPSWLPLEPIDIRTLNRKYKNSLTTIRDSVDVVVGGPPCQGFSLAGRRVEHDERNLLFQEYIKFVELVRPSAILFENVPGFSYRFKNGNSANNSYFEILRAQLKRIGYDVPVQEIVNFAEYGVPQSRKRLILYATEKGNDSFRFIESLKNKKTGTKINVKEAISDLRRANGEVISPDSPLFKSGRYGNIESKYQEEMRKGVNWDIPDSHRFARHSEIIENRFELILDKAGRNKSLNLELRDKLGIKKRNTIPLDSKLSSPTLTTLPDDYIHYEEPRILTVREYARLQSFPDLFEFKGSYTTGGKRRVNDTPRYTQIANAVPPKFAEIVGRTLMKII